MKGRQDAAAVDQARCRLADLRRQAEAGTIDLVFLDEPDALTHPYLARCWARRGADLRIAAPGQAKRRALLGAYDLVRCRLLVRTSVLNRLRRLARRSRGGLRRHGPNQASRCGARQWPDPQEQTDSKGPGRTPLADHRMAAQVYARAERDRALLARSQAAPSRQSHLHRCRRPPFTAPSTASIASASPIHRLQSSRLLSNLVHMIIESGQL